MSQLPRAELNQSLSVPGLEVTPPVSAGAAMAQEIFKSVGMIGATVGRIGQIVGQKADEEQASIDAGLRGQAALDMQNQMPVFEQMVDDKKMDSLLEDWEMA